MPHIFLLSSFRCPSTTEVVVKKSPLAISPRSLSICVSISLALTFFLCLRFPPQRTMCVTRAWLARFKTQLRPGPLDTVVWQCQHGIIDAHRLSIATAEDAALLFKYVPLSRSLSLSVFLFGYWFVVFYTCLCLSLSL